MNFNAFVNDIRENQWNVFGVEVYESGQLTHEYGNTRDSRFPIYSATKAILSIAVGIAQDRGKFDIEKPLLAYLPAEVTKQMPEKQIAAFQDITIKRLLTMSVDGFPFRPEGESYLTYSLSCPIKDTSSRIFNYSNIPAYLVGVALTHAVSEDLFAYSEPSSFHPVTHNRSGLSAVSRRLFLRRLRHETVRPRFKPGRFITLSRRRL